MNIWSELKIVVLSSCRMTVWLSTAPTEPLTHWYQVRCLLQSPLFAKAGDTMSGTALLIANKRLQLIIIIIMLTPRKVVLFLQFN